MGRQTTLLAFIFGESARRSKVKARRTLAKNLMLEQLITCFPRFLQLYNFSVCLNATVAVSLKLIMAPRLFPQAPFLSPPPRRAGPGREAGCRGRKDQCQRHQLTPPLPQCHCQRQRTRARPPTFHHSLKDRQQG